MKGSPRSAAGAFVVSKQNNNRTIEQKNRTTKQQNNRTTTEQQNKIEQNKIKDLE